MPDQSTQRVLSKCLKDNRLSYHDMQSLIESTFDYGAVTREELSDLKSIYIDAKKFRPEEVSLFMLQRFINHLDRRFSLDQAARSIPLTLSQIDAGQFRATSLQMRVFGPFATNPMLPNATFDAEYKPDEGRVVVTLKFKYKWQAGICDQEKDIFRRRVRVAESIWNNSGVYLKTRDLALNPIIHFTFNLIWVVSGEHVTIDVENEERREWFGSDLNVWKGTSEKTLVHELGHCFGNYDEYECEGWTGWFEQRAYWHDNDYIEDEKAVMNDGREFRVRYFQHFTKWVNHHFKDLKISYQTLRRP